MKIELYSMRTNKDDLEQLNQSFDEIVSDLLEENIEVTYKTEVSPNSQKVKKALSVSVEDEEKPDMIVIANALNTTSSASFRDLFADAITDLEKTQEVIVDKKDKTSIKKKVKIHSLGDFGENYKAYCFIYSGVKVVVLPMASLTNRDIKSLIYQGISKSEEKFSETKDKFPNGFAEIEVKNEKKGFIKSVFPQSSDSSGEKARKSIVLLAVVVFIVAAGFLINTLIIQPAQNKKIQGDLRQIANNVSGEATDPDSGKALTKNWAELKKINPDIVGWVTVDNTRIDYPVLENKNDTSSFQQYLYHDYKKRYNIYGSIFLDYRCKESVNSKSVVLHGHHMNDGSMFANLLNYGGARKDGYVADLDFYKKAPTITLFTPESTSTYKIFSVFKTNVLKSHGPFFNYMQSSFNSDAEFMNFVYNLKVRSLINVPIDINENDQLINLSTCSYEYDDFRTVIVGRKVREDENFSVDLSKVTLNDKAVWPQVHYNSRGGTRPKVTTFKTELKDGKINWYDGKGNLKGEETLSGSIDTTPVKNKDNKVVYSVEFINYDGSTLKKQQVEEGKAADAPPTPTKPADNSFTYKFSGWQLDFSKVTSNMVIAPNFEAIPK